MSKTGVIILAVWIAFCSWAWWYYEPMRVFRRLKWEKLLREMEKNIKEGEKNIKKIKEWNKDPDE